MTTDMRTLFYGCSGLTSLNLSHFNTGNVTDMSRMFYGCESLSSLDLSNFNTEKVTDMNSMFSMYDIRPSDPKSSLTSINLISFNTANVTDMNRMFNGCSGLTSLDVSKFRAGRSCVLSVASEQVRAEQGADDGHVLVLQCVLALALSGESRLRLGIAQASLALLSACTALQTVVDLLCHAVVVSVRQARQIVGCKCFLCHNLIFFKRLILIFCPLRVQSLPCCRAVAPLRVQSLPCCRAEAPLRAQRVPCCRAVAPLRAQSLPCCRAVAPLRGQRVSRCRAVAPLRGRRALPERRGPSRRGKRGLARRPARPREIITSSRSGGAEHQQLLLFRESSCFYRSQKTYLDLENNTPYQKF